MEKNYKRKTDDLDAKWHLLSKSVQNAIVTLMQMASDHGWFKYEWQENTRMLSFFKDDMRINVYYTRMTVGTVVNHPTQGRTQLFRRNVSLELMEKLFENPRQHTGRGYQKK